MRQQTNDGKFQLQHKTEPMSTQPRNPSALATPERCLGWLDPAGCSVGQPPTLEGSGDQSGDEGGAELPAEYREACNGAKTGSELRAASSRPIGAARLIDCSLFSHVMIDRRARDQCNTFHEFRLSSKLSDLVIRFGRSQVSECGR